MGSKVPNKVVDDLANFQNNVVREATYRAIAHNYTLRLCRLGNDPLIPDDLVLEKMLKSLSVHPSQLGRWLNEATFIPGEYFFAYSRLSQKKQLKDLQPFPESDIVVSTMISVIRHFNIKYELNTWAILNDRKLLLLIRIMNSMRDNPLCAIPPTFRYEQKALDELTETTLNYSQKTFSSQREKQDHLLRDGQAILALLKEWGLAFCLLREGWKSNWNISGVEQ